MISRFEKVLLIILVGLGVGYWGYGLLVLIMTLGERSNHQDLYFLLNRAIGTGMFVFLEVMIIENRLQRRYLAWLVIVAIIIMAVGLTYLFEGILAHA